jgi:hypothetical protein
MAQPGLSERGRAFPISCRPEEGRKVTFLPFSVPIELARRATRILLATAVFADVVIALRVWLQIRGIAPDGMPEKAIYGLSSPFIAPFRDVDPSPSSRVTGIVDFPALLAFEFFLVVAIGLFLTGLPLVLAQRLVRSHSPQWIFDPAIFGRAASSWRTAWENADHVLAARVQGTAQYARSRDWAGCRSSGIRRLQSGRDVWTGANHAISARVDLIVTCVKMHDWADTRSSIACAWHEFTSMTAAADRELLAWLSFAWNQIVLTGMDFRLLSGIFIDELQSEVTRLHEAGSREYNDARRSVRSIDWRTIRHNVARRFAAEIPVPNPNPEFPHYSRREFFERIRRGFDSAA